MRARRPFAAVEEGPASRAMMVLLSKQVHLQKEVGAVEGRGGERLAGCLVWVACVDRWGLGLLAAEVRAGRRERRERRRRRGESKVMVLFRVREGKVLVCLAWRRGKRASNGGLAWCLAEDASGHATGGTGVEVP